MRFRSTSLILHVLTIVALAGHAMTARADEGMWLFNFPPKKTLKEKHDFVPTDAWLTHLQLSSVRVGEGGFVRLGRRPADDQPSHRGRRAAKARHEGSRLDAIDLLRPDQR